MTDLEKSILAAIVYYDLLDKPLTALEIKKYLPAQNRAVSFFEIKNLLDGSPYLKRFLEQKNGLHFLQGRRELAEVREKKLKLAQIKWKKFIRLSKILATSPFLKMAAATGSLTVYNARNESDFDLLIVTEKNRMWTVRIFLTILTHLLGVRRKKNLTADRFCLNCYIACNDLEIKTESKPHDFHSAQEYARLTPLLEIEPEIYKKFLTSNKWISDFIFSYPWTNGETLKKIKPGKCLSLLRGVLETALSGSAGDAVENFAEYLQAGRIKNTADPADQIYVSRGCLMLHPHSKSYGLLKKYENKLNNLTF